MTKRGNHKDVLSETLDELSREMEMDLVRRPTPTTSRLLAGLDTILWEVARMEEALRVAQPDVVTTDDIRALTKVFRRIEREASSVTSWLRLSVLEEPRH